LEDVWLPSSWWRRLEECAAFLTMETAHDSKMLVTVYETTWHCIPQDSNLHSHCHDNLISHGIFLSYQRSSLFSWDSVPNKINWRQKRTNFRSTGFLCTGDSLIGNPDKFFWWKVNFSCTSVDVEVIGMLKLVSLCLETQADMTLHVHTYNEASTAGGIRDWRKRNEPSRQALGQCCKRHCFSKFHFR
jgi:hypothetical protein